MFKPVRALVCATDRAGHDLLETILGTADMVEIVGHAYSGGEALVIHKSQWLDVVVIDGRIDGCDGVRLAGALCRERSIPVLVVVDEGRERTVLREAAGRGVFDARAISWQAVRERSETARSRLRTQVQLLGSLSQRQEPKASASFGDSTAVRPEIAELAQSHYDAIALLGSAGTPHMLPRLFADVSGRRVPLFVAVHHNPRLSASFHTWIAELTGLEARAFDPESGAPIVLDAPLHVAIPAGKGATLPPDMDEDLVLEPDLGVCLRRLLDVRLRLLVCVASGMAPQGVEAMSLARRRGGRIVVLDPQDCSHPAMAQAAIKAGVVDQISSIDEFAWLLGRVSSHPKRTSPSQHVA